MAKETITKEHEEKLLGFVKTLHNDILENMKKLSREEFNEYIKENREINFALLKRDILDEIVKAKDEEDIVLIAKVILMSYEKSENLIKRFYKESEK